MVISPEQVVRVVRRLDPAEAAPRDRVEERARVRRLKDSKILAEKDYYCAGYKMDFEHALRRVHGDLVRAVQAQRA